MHKEYLLERLEQNIKAKFRYIPSSIASMEVISGSGPLLINSNLPSDMFNIICCEHASDIHEIDNIIAYFTFKEKPAAWWTGFQSDPSALENTLQYLGYTSDEEELAMVATLDNIPLQTNIDLNIEKVTTLQTLHDFIRIISSLLPNEALAIQQYFSKGQHLLLHPEARLKCFVGYLHNKPISTATVFLAEEVAGIFDIIALPEVRGKGVGSAMTLAAMHEGQKHGYKYATLTATNEAKVVYQKLGFQALAKMQVYPITAAH